MRRLYAQTCVSLAAGLLWSALFSGCGEDLYVGSDVLWTARYETGDLTEWTSVAGGGTDAVAPNMLEVSREQVHGGDFAARLNITTPSDATHTSASLLRAGGLPTEAYYSAWYFVPQPVTVGTYWVIMKFRLRTAVGDASSAGELLDLDLKSQPGGGMSLHLFDHRRGGDVPIEMTDPVIPLRTWFQIEAYYRDSQDGTGRVTYWLNGQQLVDMTDQTLSPTPWVEWHVCSVGESLTPQTVLLYVDDEAISHSRVGPMGEIAH